VADRKPHSSEKRRGRQQRENVQADSLRGHTQQRRAVFFMDHDAVSKPHGGSTVCGALARSHGYGEVKRQ
jgi:hypothetical protein